MIAHVGRILTISSCFEGHDHGAFSMKWIWESADPYALVLTAEGTDQFWMLDRLDFTEKMMDVHWSKPRTSGVATFKLRASQPEVLSLYLTHQTETGPRITYVLCRASDVAQFMDKVNLTAPAYNVCDVDATIRRIFTEA